MYYIQKYRVIHSYSHTHNRKAEMISRATTFERGIWGQQGGGSVCCCIMEEVDETIGSMITEIKYNSEAFNH